jgi:hypothetical protein
MALGLCLCVDDERGRGTDGMGGAMGLGLRPNCPALTSGRFGAVGAARRGGPRFRGWIFKILGLVWQQIDKKSRELIHTGILNGTLISGGVSTRVYLPITVWQPRG